VPQHQDAVQLRPAGDRRGIRAAALQFVRKLSGFNAPSKLNQVAFDHAVEEVADVARGLVGSLVTLAPPRNRELERAKAAAEAARRFGPR